MNAAARVLRNAFPGLQQIFIPFVHVRLRVGVARNNTIKINANNINFYLIKFS